MKVILKSEVDNLGLPGDVVDVADGYGRNFLIPRGMAILATRGAMKDAEAITRARKVREATTVDQARSYKDVIEDRVLRIPVRVDDHGRLYGSVSVNDVHRVLKERGHDIERRRIDLKRTIKQIGSYEIPVQIHPQVLASVTVQVVDEEGRVNLDGSIELTEEEQAAAAADAAAAAEAGEGSATDADVLAEQALEAAQQYEQDQADLDDADTDADADRADADRADASDGEAAEADATA